MLTQLSTLKARLALLPTDTTYDALLTSAIVAVSARFDKETNRTLARTENAGYEFDTGDTELSPPCYPIEAVARFETKSGENSGWVEQPGVQFLIRKSCIISLQTPLNLQPATFNLQLSRVTYTGGYRVPGSPPLDPLGAVCQDLPADLEHAAVEQTAFWFQRRDKLGLKISWPSGGIYQQFIAQDLLDSVAATLRSYRRMTLC